MDNDHVAPEKLAAYLNRTVSAAESAEIERHLVRCEACRHDLREGWELSSPSRRGRWLAVGATVAAAAAAAVLLVSGPGGPAREQGQPVLRRGQTPGTPAFEAVAPVDGARLDRDTLVFRWRSERAAASYHLTLTDENGDVLWSATTADTVIPAPPTLTLPGARRYFWYVDALLEGTRSSTTGVREFMIER